MAIYHLEAKVVSRGTGRSAVAASAYQKRFVDIHSTADRINDFEHNTSPQFEDLREVAGRDWTLTESLKQSVSPKISLQGSTPYLFALERASGTHNNSVQRIAVPTHPPTCCVVCPFL